MVPNPFVTLGVPLAFAGVFLVIGVAVLLFAPLIIIVVANRAEPDGRGMRPFTVYLFGMSYFTLNLAYAGLTLIVTELLSFISPHPVPIGNSVAKYAVIGGLLFLIAGTVLQFHFRQGVAAAKADGRIDGPNARVLHTYLGVVSFIYLFIFMIALGFAIYLIFQLIAGGVFGSIGGAKSGTVSILLDSVYLMIISGAIVYYSWKKAPAGTLRMPVMPSMPPAPTPPTPPAS